LEEALLPEHYFTRYISLAGHVHQSWPKEVSRKVESIQGGLQIIGGDKVPSRDILGDLELDDLAWIGDQDALGGFLR